jgi:hypothetical protein
MTLSALGIFSAAGAGGVAGATYELIETQILGSSQASITFSNLGTYSSTYKHLQVRAVSKSNHAAVWEVGRISVNGDFAGNYSSHNLYGNGSIVGANGETNGSSAYFATSGATTSTNFGPQVIDFLDPYSTTKNKTFRALSGSMGATEIRLSSGAWRNNAAITSITLWTFAGTAWLTGSRFSIYGIRG